MEEGSPQRASMKAEMRDEKSKGLFFLCSIAPCGRRMEGPNILQDGKMETICILQGDRIPSRRRPQGAMLQRKNKLFALFHPSPGIISPIRTSYPLSSIR